MSYQEIAAQILSSREIRIPVSADSGVEKTLVPAIAFVNVELSRRLTLEDRGSYLNLDIVPVIEEISAQEVADWETLMAEDINYIEINERWFAEQPSGVILKRFHGIKIFGGRCGLNIELSDDVVCAFIINTWKI